jgi:predicted Ser/Thr protein kinase
MEDLTGRQFGAYRVVAPLGEGGMAAVYKAYQANMDRYVALKILPSHLASDPQFVGRFEQEAKMVARLQHTNILPVFDFGEADGYTYIVMPFVETGTLAQLLAKGPLPLSRICQVVSQVASALDYAHAKGVVHRDVKPTNVLLDQQGNCLLTDFGIAKIVEGTSIYTQTGAIVGTPAYMSPEQIRGEKLDGRSDIYSLGIILYEMATGRTPFRAETPPAIFVKHLLDPLPPPHLYNANLSEGVERVILKSLSKDRESRFQTAGEMAAALTKVAASPGPPGVEAPAAGRHAATELARPPQPPRAPSRFPAWGLPVIGLLAVAGVLAIVFGVLRGDQDDAAVTPAAGLTAAVGAATPGPDLTAEAPAVVLATTAVPTPTPIAPTATWTPIPSAVGTTPVPSSSPTPTSPPTPTSLPTHTATPSPSPTEPPTDTPVPTATFTPTPVPTTAPPPVPEVRGLLTFRGAPVAGIPLALISGPCNAAGVVQNTVTDAEGRYRFPSLSAGTYTIAINGWNGTATPVEPFETTCTWELQVTSGAQTLDWTLHKTDLRITSPMENETVGTTTPTFVWDPYPNATRYGVILLQVRPTRETIEWGTPVVGTSFSSATGLVPGRQYNLLIWAYEGDAQIAVGSVYFWVG